MRIHNHNELRRIGYEGFGVYLADQLSKDHNLLHTCRQDEFLNEYYVKRSFDRLEFVASFEEIRHALNGDFSAEYVRDKLAVGFERFLEAHGDWNGSQDGISNELAGRAMAHACGTTNDDVFSYISKETALSVAEIFFKENDQPDNVKLRLSMLFAKPYFELSCSIRPAANWQAGFEQSAVYGAIVFNALRGEILKCSVKTS